MAFRGRQLLARFLERERPLAGEPSARGEAGWAQIRLSRILLQDAIFLQCDSFLTMERKLPNNAAHIERELGIRVLAPISYWEILRPWAALWW
jgi:hypothetical protein